MRKNNFELVVRVLVVKKGKILLCRMKGHDYYFLPGGHVEFGELSEEALRREVREELGVEVKHFKLAGVIENIFGKKTGRRHEIGFIFEASLASGGRISSKEKHIDFEWKNIKDLNRENVKPKILKNIIKSWLRTRKIFWSRQRED